MLDAAPQRGDHRRGEWWTNEEKRNGVSFVRHWPRRMTGLLCRPSASSNTRTVL